MTRWSFCMQRQWAWTETHKRDEAHLFSFIGINGEIRRRHEWTHHMHKHTVQLIASRCAMCGAQNWTATPPAHSMAPNSKTSGHSSSMTPSRACSKDSLFGAASSSGSRSMTDLLAFSSMLQALAAFKVFLSTDSSRSRLMAIRGPSKEVTLSKQLGSGRLFSRRPRTFWRWTQSGCRCSWSFLKMRDSHACSFWTSVSKLGGRSFTLFLNLPYHFLPSSVK